MSVRSSLRDRLRRNKPERGTLVVSRNSWHGRLYHFWRANSEFKNTSNYRENLCHYVRVILFWAPIAAFLHSKPRVLGGLRPAVVTGGLAAVAGVITAFVVNPGGSLIFMLSVLAITVVVVGVIFLAYQLEENKYEIRQWWRNNGRGARPIKTFGRVARVPFRLLGRGIVWLGEHVYDPIVDFGAKEVLGDFPLGAVFFLFVTVAAVVLGAIFIDILFLLIALGVVGVGLLLVGLLFLGDFIRDLLDDLGRRNRGRERVKKDEGLLKVGARFAVAKKGKICPFIEVK